MWTFIGVFPASPQWPSVAYLYHPNTFPEKVTEVYPVPKGRDNPARNAVGKLRNKLLAVLDPNSTLIMMNVSYKQALCFPCFRRNHSDLVKFPNRNRIHDSSFRWKAAQLRFPYWWRVERIREYTFNMYYVV